MKILLVEDSPTQAALTTQELSQINSAIDIERAMTVREATMATLLRKFDLIILDVSLPDGNGLDVCRTLKGNESTQRVPIVLFSAERLSDLRRDAYAAGADYCITKGDTGGMTLSLLVSTIFRRASRSSVA
jgi:DNA-binding response OmpR family regulator